MQKQSSIREAGNRFSVYFGIILEDKLPNAETISVTLRELSPFVTGDVGIQTDTVQVGDTETKMYESVEMTNAIEAEYFSLLTNRRYAPDVKKGESVLIFQYADSKKYYWFPIGRDDRQRLTERVTISASNNLTTPKGLSDGNTYSLELDTKYHRHILLRTSKTTGEKYQYQIKIDADTNSIQLCDDIGNQIYIDSAVPRVFLTNSSGAYIDIAKDSIVALAKEDILLKAGRQIVIDAPNITERAKSGSGVIKQEARNITRQADSAVVDKAPSIGLDGAVVANSIVADGITSTGYSTGRFKR